MHTQNDQLKVSKGDIYNLPEEEFDAAVVFLRHGFNSLSAELNINEEELRASKIGYVLFCYSGHRDSRWKQYKGSMDFFSSEEEAEAYIREMVDLSLNYALRCGNRIAFHGIQILGMEPYHNEEVTIQAVRHWLSSHSTAIVTMVDKLGHFNRHDIQYRL